jgi:hypothetical protein
MLRGLIFKRSLIADFIIPGSAAVNNMFSSNRNRVRWLFFSMLTGVSSQLNAAKNDDFVLGKSVVLSAMFGVCMDVKLGAIVRFRTGEDFTPGEIHVGQGKVYRRIDYGVGTRFDSALTFKADQRLNGLGYKILRAEDRKNGVFTVKATGLGNVDKLDVSFSYPIGDTVSARYTDQIVSNLFTCKVVRTSK